jgi:glucose/arabinose dehydrogenase
MIPRAFARLSPLLRSRRLSFALTLLVAAAWAPAPARCQIVVPDGFSDQLLVGGLDAPVGMAWLPDGRLLFIEQNSRRIRLLVNGALASTDPVAVVDDVKTGGERGLLGIAVDPGWPARPYVYVHCDNQSAETIRVSRYTVTGDLGFTGNGALAIGTSSRYDLINDVPDVMSNHNGGTLRFGTDGMLYASFGEDANKCAAQDLDLHGVILRLDVSRLPAGSGGPPPRALIVPPGNPFPAVPDSNALLVWAYGLRNPFRFQIDPMDNALWIGDVGEDKREEIDRAPMGGLNFGWPIFEGTLTNTTCSGSPTDLVDPVYEYDRSGGTAAVICGGAYRRPSGASSGFPASYEGDVFFNDYYFGFLRRLTPDGSGGWRIADPVPGQASPTNWGSGFQAVSDWSVGPDGALWYVRQSLNFQGTSGQIRKIVAMSGPDTLPVDTLPRSGIEFARPFPIPARGAVNLSYTLSEPARVSLKIYDSRGALVRTLVPDGVQSATRHDVLWLGIDDAGEDVPAGIYYARYVVPGRDRSFMIPLIR